MTPERPRVYLDHAATTPLRAEVAEAMRPYFTEHFGNPSSIHRRGQKARAAVEGARRELAEVLGVPASSVVFTGSGTEANNLALRGAWERGGGLRLVCTGTEHDSVLSTVDALAKRGAAVERVPVDRTGAPDLDALAEVVGRGPVLATVSWVNSETGRIAPVDAVAEIVHAGGGLLHVDAVQALGKLPGAAIRALDADLITLSAHKIEGPKGSGALVVRGDVPLEAQTTGGGQEFGLRSGTENVAGIVGFARAARLRGAEQPDVLARVEALAERLRAALAERVPAEAIHSQRALCSPFIVNFAVPGVPGELLVQGLDLEGYEVSAGSACGSGKLAVSPVLGRMGVPHAAGALRVSFGRETTDDEVEGFVAALDAVRERAGR